MKMDKLSPGDRVKIISNLGEACFDNTVGDISVVDWVLQEGQESYYVLEMYPDISFYRKELKKIDDDVDYSSLDITELTDILKSPV